MKNETIITPVFTLCFPTLFVPEASGNDPTPYYTFTAVFEPDSDLTEMRRLAQASVKASFPKGLPPGFRNPFQLGDRKYEKWGDIFRGRIYVRMKTKFKPGVCDAQRIAIDNPEMVYGGQKARAAVSVYAYDNQGNRGVAFNFSAVQIVADGERLGFSPEKAIEQFEAVAPAADAGTSSSPNPFDDFGI